MKKLYALRGAAQCLNTRQDICHQVLTMYEELLNRNKLDESDIVSAIFSVTSDLDAINPCTALRMSGKAANTALFGVQEPQTEGALERTVRAMIHCYLEEGVKVCHVYRNGAQVLRPDIAQDI